MNNLNVDYKPSQLKIVDSDVGLLFDICKQNMKEKNALVGFENEVNLLFKIHFNAGGTLKEVREFLINTKLYSYLKIFIDEVEKDKIKTLSQFVCWIQGNDKSLPINNIKKLSAHTHPYRIHDDSVPINTRTFIVPILIREEIKEYFWFKYIENTMDTMPKKSLLSGFNDSFDFINWWEKLRVNFPGEEKKYFLPNINQQMIINFNSRNWLHGIDDINSNLYLYILFDDIIYE
jgi:hypothetical protein